jgi:hypothetical protein
MPGYAAIAPEKRPVPPQYLRFQGRESDADIVITHGEFLMTRFQYRQYPQLTPVQMWHKNFIRKRNKTYQKEE